MLSIAGITVDWGVVARPDKLEPFWVMINAVAYVAISEGGCFNISLKHFFCDRWFHSGNHLISRTLSKKLEGQDKSSPRGYYRLGVLQKLQFQKFSRNKFDESYLTFVLLNARVGANVSFRLKTCMSVHCASRWRPVRYFSLKY